MGAFLHRHATTLRWLALVLVVGALVVAFRVLDLEPYVERAAEWIDSLGVLGPVVFAAAYAVAVVLLVPGSVLTLAAGAAFGLWLGVVTVSAGATLGATLAFLVARYLARERIAAMARKKPRHLHGSGGCIGVRGGPDAAAKGRVLVRAIPRGIQLPGSRVAPTDPLRSRLERGSDRLRPLASLAGTSGCCPGRFMRGVEVLGVISARPE
ncbi:MAG: VTT domain-containing protein [Planctomycetota bacterium]